MKLKVDGHPNLVRDADSKAIIMQNQDAFKAYQAERTFRESMSNNNSSTQQEINILKEEMSEIKGLLVALLGKIEQK